MLTKHQNVFFFSKSKGDLGHTDLVQHKINTGSAVPIKQSLRRLPYGKRQTEKEKILRMLDLGVIEPLHLVKKKLKLMLSWFFFWSVWSQKKELVQILIKLKLFKTGPDQKHLLQEICEKTLQS